MMDRFLLNLNKFTDSNIKIYITGLFFALAISLIAVAQLSYYNFQIFSFGSTDFWIGINPYSDWNHLSVLGKPLDFYLYSPQFSILFTPFALLPGWLGLFCWILFTYTLFYFSVFTLPEQFTFVKKKFILDRSFLLLLQTLFAEQFNPVVAALFLFSFTLLEKDKAFWAVLLILLSGFTKIYGIFQIGMLLFYPRIWKNILYASIIAVLFLLLPLVKVPANMLADYYQSWIKIVNYNASTPLNYEIIYRPFYMLYNSIKPVMGIISLGVMAFLYSIAFYKIRLFKESFLHRVRFLGILLVSVILFGMASERNTYIIAIVGYAMWYLCSQTTKIDKILLWINFVLLEIVPIDLFCPASVSTFLLTKLNLNIIVLTITWGFMVYKTFNSNPSTNLYSTI